MLMFILKTPMAKRKMTKSHMAVRIVTAINIYFRNLFIVGFAAIYRIVHHLTLPLYSYEERE